MDGKRSSRLFFLKVYVALFRSNSPCLLSLVGGVHGDCGEDREKEKTARPGERGTLLGPCWPLVYLEASVRLGSRRVFDERPDQAW